MFLRDGGAGVGGLTLKPMISLEMFHAIIAPFKALTKTMCLVMVVVWILTENHGLDG